ncbi:Glycosyltransferase involved in cell wall bisynthesis [Alteromonadaceae bacterium Bs31]|nr:Glycosyltransferase involved in cell wall bisynthesis [Alteromonadaceae bacterium Bs31]
MLTEPRLNILHVILSRGFAGSERSTAESCNQQCKHHNVTLIIKKNHRKNGISIVDNLDPSVKVEIVPVRILTQYFLNRLIRKSKANIIHAHLRRATRLIAKINPPAATVSTLHIGVNGPHFLQMDGLICNARWQIEAITGDYAGQTFKANNSVQSHRRLSGEEVFALRHSLGVEDHQLLIGAVGRYNASKAWDTLIKAFKQLDKPDLILLFFGSGSQEQELKQLASGDQRIRFIGYRSDIKDLYQTFDLAACPSRFEPLPRVMLEAMDAGIPVIASDTGGCKELIEDYGGYIFRTDDIDDLVRVLTSCTKRKLAAHKPDLSAHYVENANAAMEGFYRRLVESKQNKTPSQ